MLTNASLAIIGAGPAGLFAAERLASAGHAVTVFDRMPSPARKFLFAGRGGLNLTHSEPFATFLTRYGAAAEHLAPALAAFPPDALKAWADGLGEAPFIGTSGRVFPKSFKATPLLRGWLRRLDGLGVTFRFGHAWQGWDSAGALRFASPDGEVTVQAAATLLALGGASWPRLGSNGTWQAILAERGIAVSPLAPSNVGLLRVWSAPFLERHDGAPLKGMALTAGDITTRAEAVVTRSGLEGGAVYALSAPLRAAIAKGQARLTLDLKPDMPAEALAVRLASARKGDSLSNILRKQAGLSAVGIGILREAGDVPRDPAGLAARIKALPLTIDGLMPLDRAISTAGGIRWTEIDGGYMLKRLPGVFVAGEMLDWDAPTGGYLLQGCFSTAHNAAAGISAYLQPR